MEHDSSLHTIYTNFSSPRVSESNDKYAPLTIADKFNKLQYRLNNAYTAVVANKPIQTGLKKISKQTFLSKAVNQSTQTDPIKITELCPTLEAKLRMLEL
jgi:hypothetical protein